MGRAASKCLAYVDLLEVVYRTELVQLVMHL